MSCCSDKMEPIKANSCCTPHDTAQHAAKTMRDTGCGCAPVVKDKQSRQLVGVVTERDVCHHVAADDRRASEVPIEGIMHSASACCSMDESLEEASRKLREHRASSLPVVGKAGCCCGTVSTHHLDKMGGQE